MPHAVETMFSVREVPWHGLGRIVQEAPDSEQALVLGGLAWAVNQTTIQVAGASVEGYKANVRATDGKVLGIVGDTYKVMQNREAFNWMDGMLGEGAKYETAGALHGGKTVWMLAKMPEEFRVAGDAVTTYLLVSNSHNGTSAIRAAVVPVRVVCQNTLNLALSRAHRQWSIRHSGNLGAKLEEGRRALGLVHKYMEDLTTMADTLRTRRVSPDEWTEIVNKLMPVKAEDQVKHTTTLERQKERQQALWNRMMVPDLEAHRWTAWGAVNAVADYADHAAPARETETSKENRFRQVVGGHTMLDKAFELLV